MQTANNGMARLIVMALLWAGPALGDDKDPAQFDLICHGTVDKTIGDELKSESFTIRFRVDLKRNAFCGEAYCGTFAPLDGPKLEYHCDVASHGYSCGAPLNRTPARFMTKKISSLIVRTAYFTGLLLVTWVMPTHVH